MADPKDVVSRLVESFNAGEPTALLNELYADDAEFVRPGLRLTSRQAYGDYLKRLVVVSPDAKLSIKRMIGEGETAVAEYEFTGTMKGKRVKFTTIIIADVVDGKITSLHEVFDSAAVMAQLGPAVPAGASTSDPSP